LRFHGKESRSNDCFQSAIKCNPLEKLKLMQLTLHYVIPKLRSNLIGTNKTEDLPLFLD